MIYDFYRLQGFDRIEGLMKRISNTGKLILATIAIFVSLILKTKHYYDIFVYSFWRKRSPRKC